MKHSKINTYNDERKLQMTKTKVLFLCTGNSARSQMAEALLRWHAGDYFDVYSAGLEPKTINPNTLVVMDEYGIDMTGHQAKSLDQYLGKVHFGYLITVCSKAEDKCPVFPGMGIRLHWAFDDPVQPDLPEQEQLDLFRKIRDEIDCRILDWLSEQGVQAQS